MVYQSQAGVLVKLPQAPLIPGQFPMGVTLPILAFSAGVKMRLLVVKEANTIVNAIKISRIKIDFRMIFLLQFFGDAFGKHLSIVSARFESQKGSLNGGEIVTLTRFFVSNG